MYQACKPGDSPFESASNRVDDQTSSAIEKVPARSLPTLVLSHRLRVTPCYSSMSRRHVSVTAIWSHCCMPKRRLILSRFYLMADTAPSFFDIYIKRISGVNENERISCRETSTVCQIFVPSRNSHRSDEIMAKSQEIVKGF